MVVVLSVVHARLQPIHHTSIEPICRIGRNLALVNLLAALNIDENLPLQPGESRVFSWDLRSTI